MNGFLEKFSYLLVKYTTQTSFGKFEKTFIILIIFLKTDNNQINQGVGYNIPVHQSVSKLGFFQSNKRAQNGLCYSIQNKERFLDCALQALETGFTFLLGVFFIISVPID